MSASSSRSSRRDHLLLAAFALSGAAALGYEILWTRLLALALGSETLGILGTLAGFFAGMALGSALLHTRAREARDPVHMFALLELIAAGFALVSPYLLYALARLLPPVIGPAASSNGHFVGLALALGIATLALLPGTLPMGATLAALVEARRRTIPDGHARGLGRLYAANTAGATLGVLASIFFILPRVGFAAGSIVLSTLGIAAAALAILWSQSPSIREKVAPKAATPDKREPPRTPAAAAQAAASASGPKPRHVWPYAALAVSGFAGLGLEVVGVQVLAQNMEDTVYTFAGALAVYLLGTAAGAWLYSTQTNRIRTWTHAEVTAALLIAQIATVAIAARILGASRAWLEYLAPTGSGYLRGVTSEIGIAAAVFFLPTLVMGALFSHLMAAVAERGVGRAYAVNTLGSMAAPVVFGLGAIRWWGYTPAILLVLAAYGLLLAAFLTRLTPRTRRRWLVAASLAALSATLVPARLDLVDLPTGWKPLFRKPSLYGLVMVSEEIESQLPGRALSRRLQVNRHFRMGGSTSFGERRMGHLPLLFAPEARKALFLGIGTGATLSAVRHFHQLEQVDAVELVPEVLEALSYFEHVNESVAEDPRVRLHRADARRFISASRDRYDVIIADLFHPARDGAGSLYAREHFALIASKLAEDGLFCQWLPLYQFDVENLRTVIRTFVDVFPNAHSFLGIYNVETPALALLGYRDGDRAAVTTRQLASQLAKPVYDQLLMTDLRDLLGAYQLDRPALMAFAGVGPLNTDLTPHVMFRAPRSAYERQPSLQWNSLRAVLAATTAPPAELLTIAPEHAGVPEEGGRFAAALGHYLHGEILRVGAEMDGGIPDLALERYFQAYETAPGFTPALAILFRIASADTSRTETILTRMLRRDPSDERTHRAYLSFLRWKGETDRHAQALAAARRRLGEDFGG